MCSYMRMRGLVSEEVRDTKLFFVTCLLSHSVNNMQNIVTF